MESGKLEGGCLCGAVRYRVAGPSIVTCHCHCTMCRRASGAAFVTWTCVPVSDFEWIQGAPVLYRSSPEAERGFCPACGTQLTFRRDGERHDGALTLDVTSATLDHPERVSPSVHLWLASRLAWDILPEDGLERFDEGFPPERYG